MVVCVHAPGCTASVLDRVRLPPRVECGVACDALMGQLLSLCDAARVRSRHSGERMPAHPQPQLPWRVGQVLCQQMGGLPCAPPHSHGLGQEQARGGGLLWSCPRLWSIAQSSLYDADPPHISAGHKMELKTATPVHMTAYNIPLPSAKAQKAKAQAVLQIAKPVPDEGVGDAGRGGAGRPTLGRARVRTHKSGMTVCSAETASVRPPTLPPNRSAPAGTGTAAAFQPPIPALAAALEAPLQPPSPSSAGGSAGQHGDVSPWRCGGRIVRERRGGCGVAQTSVRSHQCQGAFVRAPTAVDGQPAFGHGGAIRTEAVCRCGGGGGADPTASVRDPSPPPPPHTHRGKVRARRKRKVKGW